MYKYPLPFSIENQKKEQSGHLNPTSNHLFFNIFIAIDTANVCARLNVKKSKTIIKKALSLPHRIQKME